jgi:hypothetical protein
MNISGIDDFYAVHNLQKTLQTGGLEIKIADSRVGHTVRVRKYRYGRKKPGGINNLFHAQFCGTHNVLTQERLNILGVKFF